MGSSLASRARSATLGALVSAAAMTACNVWGPSLCDDPVRGACNRAATVDPAASLATYRSQDAAQRPDAGGPVNIRRAVVTAIDDYVGNGGSIGTVYIQQHVTRDGFQGCAPLADGSRVCGMQLRLPLVIPTGNHLLVGDIVDVSGGAYEEFDCTPCCRAPRPPCRFTGRTLPQFSSSTVERVGSSPQPEPVPATAEQILAGGDAFVGVLVRLTTDVYLPPPDNRGEYAIAGTGRDTLNMAPDLAALVDPSNGQPLESGTRLHNVTGIVSYFYSQKILPRSTQDYEIVR